MKAKCMSMVVALLSCAGANAALVEKAVEYECDGVKLEGFSVHDDALTGKCPAVLVIHQWMGLTDNEKRRSRMLAEMGYNVFAADIYGKGIRPQSPADAGKMAGQYKGDRLLYRSRLMAGLQVLLKDELTDSSKVAAIGYCFGGTGVLEMARAGAPVKGVVSFHGGLDAAEGFAAKPGVQTKILVLHGAADPHVPATQVAAFEKEMDEAKADWQFTAYSGAVHAFTQKEAGNDPSKGVAYNEAADRRSWEAMKVFFAELFGK